MTAQQYATNSVDAVLRILMLVVYADRVKKPVERDALRQRLSQLAVFTEDRFAGSVDVLDTLIVEHEAEVENLMDDAELVQIIDDSLKRIDDPMLIPLVLEAMQTVADADDELHYAEKRLIGAARRMWDFGSPS